jgi:hypothetical protein
VKVYQFQQLCNHLCLYKRTKLEQQIQITNSLWISNYKTDGIGWLKKLKTIFNFIGGTIIELMIEIRNQVLLRSIHTYQSRDSDVFDQRQLSYQRF